ncbi:MAG: hypothetical protein IH987_11105 [Planctomycetes bacterium]|nr:hypothetical protein [Planctomycetota bacterium]
MIRKAIIVVLTLAAAGTSYLWADSYRGRVASNGRTFHGWCLDCKLSGDMGFHITVRVGGICFSYRSPVSPSAVEGLRGFALTGNFGYFGYPYRPCMVNAEHQIIEPPGMRLVAHSVCLPLWLLMIAFAVYPTIAFIRGPVRRWRRHRKGLCIRCGYNLEGNVSGVCPECGSGI